MTAIKKASANVVHIVSDEMLGVLADDIMKYTYTDVHNEDYWNGSGVPTYEFLMAFKLTNVEQKLNEIVTELYYDWQSMDYDPDTYLHGTPWGGDMRERLAEILNVDGVTGFSNKSRKPYWDIFIKQMFDDGGIKKLFDKYMKEEFAKIGITIV